ncbi:carboxymuconolactone decarboxylase family protein [Qipengyuania sediminis]|uniref:carboxymuconolactone decarboxylase family protein n=1 Tax=Qipengyuania sediminis TaxID=1532023 RepID=UPI0010598D50|nr:carboxymuconolactone decarboxylase family protein [Qipengyuania sediminis]
MSRLAIPARSAAPAAAQPLLDAVESQLGVVPNLFRLLALSPPALEGFLGLSGALSRTLDAKTREGIALATAQVNGCDYCLSAHSYLGAQVAKLDAAEIAANRRGASADARTGVALEFARSVAERRGQVDDGALEAVRRAGYGDAEIVEIVAQVALNVLTNFLNNTAETDIDFPVVSSQAA